MKRHESIVTLSRDHHFALLFCWKIRQGIKKLVPPARMQPFVQFFWENHLVPHFKDEETILFAGLKDTLCDQAYTEHKTIHDLITASGTHTPTVDSLNTLADTLDNHIRFEERTLFPHLEKQIPPDTLATIGERLQQAHIAHPPDIYPDEFWI